MLQLVIGNKNYSSWSMRAWMLLRFAEVSFSESSIDLYTPASRLQRQFSIGLKAPMADIRLAGRRARQVWLDFILAVMTEGLKMCSIQLGTSYA